MEYIVRQTEGFAQWRASLRDLKAATAIRRRIERAQAGNLGDVKPVRDGISEMRVDVGAGYRLSHQTEPQRAVPAGWRRQGIAGSRHPQRHRLGKGTEP